MGSIDARIAAKLNESARLRQREEDEAERKRQVIRPQVRAVYSAVRSVVRGNSGSWALHVVEEFSPPSVTVLRKDLTTNTKLVTFSFTEKEGVVSVSDGVASTRMDGSGAHWAAEVTIERAAASFVSVPLSIHPALKWALWILGAAIALPIVVYLVIALVQAAIAVVGIIFGVIIILRIFFGD